MIPNLSMLGNVVTFHFTLRDPQGRLLDTSGGGDPVAYLEGAAQIIDGLEAQLRGEPAGTKKTVRVPAAAAYGLRDETLVQKVPRRQLPVEGELRAGDQFRAGDDDQAPVVMIAAIEGNEVLLDANHPLAGMDLTFEVEIVTVRPATAEELRHGHAHGPGGCKG
jgi:FKBP-type peptidyl-prolyl cis-trans isomerase SlyD